MKRTRILTSVIFLMILALSFSACGKKDSSSKGSRMESDYNSAADSVAPQEPSYTEGGTDDYVEEEKTGVDLSNTSAISSEIPGEGIGEKIIRRVQMMVETEEFDNLISTIDYQISALGGYVESSEVTGQGYYKKDSTRYGNIVARIPKNKLNEFVNKVNEIGNVTVKNENTENVTLEYVDADSRKKSLQIEQERLLALLDKADSLDDILVLESRLSDVRYQLQYYETQLRTYDNLVEYSTVTLNIREVERITPVSEDKLSVWDRISTGFGDTMYRISEGLQNFFVWFVVNLPYLIIWAVIITASVMIGKKIYRKVIENSKTKQSLPPRIMPNINPNMNLNGNPNLNPNTNSHHPVSTNMNQNNQPNINSSVPPQPQTNTQSNTQANSQQNSNTSTQPEQGK